VVLTSKVDVWYDSFNCIYLYMYTRMHTYIYTYIHYIYTHNYTTKRSKSISKYMHTYIYIYIFTYAYIYIYIYIYIYMYILQTANTCSVDIKNRIGLQHNMHSAKNGAGIQAPYMELMQVQHTCGMRHSYVTSLILHISFWTQWTLVRFNALKHKTIMLYMYIHVYTCVYMYIHT